MEPESTSIKAFIKPKLSLNPAPEPEKTCRDSAPKSPNSPQRQSVSQIPETETAEEGKNIGVDGAAEVFDGSGEVSGRRVERQDIDLNKELEPEPDSFTVLSFSDSPAAFSLASDKPAGDDQTQVGVEELRRERVSCDGNLNAAGSILGKRDNEEAQMPENPCADKKGRHSPVSPNVIPQLQVVQQEGLFGKDVVEMIYPESGNDALLENLLGGSTEPSGLKALEEFQGEAVASTTEPTFGENLSLSSNSRNSGQQQQQFQTGVACKPGMSCSLSSLLDMNVQAYESSHWYQNPCMDQQTLLDRMSKIQRVAERNKLNCKETSSREEYSCKPHTYSLQKLSDCLKNMSSNEDFKDEAKPLSKSIIEGTMNKCKTLVLDFEPEKQTHVPQGNESRLVSGKTVRMFMSERQTDGSVAWCYGEVDGSHIPKDNDHLSTLPNTHKADLLASQLSSLMTREGHVVKDHLGASNKPYFATSSCKCAVATSDCWLQKHLNKSPQTVMKHSDYDTHGGLRISHQSTTRPFQTSQGSVSNVRAGQPVNSSSQQSQRSLTQQQQLLQQNQESLRQQQALLQLNQESLLQQQSLIRRSQQLLLRHQQSLFHHGSHLMQPHLPEPQLPTQPLHFGMDPTSSDMQSGSPFPFLVEILGPHQRPQQQMLIRGTGDTVSNYELGLGVAGSTMSMMRYEGAEAFPNGAHINTGQQNLISMTNASMLESLRTVSHVGVSHTNQTIGASQTHLSGPVGVPMRGINYIELAAQRARMRSASSRFATDQWQQDRFQQQPHLLEINTNLQVQAGSSSTIGYPAHRTQLQHQGGHQPNDRRTLASQWINLGGAYGTNAGNVDAGPSNLLPNTRTPGFFGRDFYSPEQNQRARGNNIRNP